jgi:LAO/AO transport system kinase
MARPLDSAEALITGIQASQVGALARAITLAEDHHPTADVVLDAIWLQVGKAWRTGMTGPPGAGKSTLADALIRHWVSQGRTPALLAVDPSSPISGGALLGDRIRMDRALEETGVFVRSMANRGSLGGLSRATGMAADLCDAAGFPEILLETVGVGQAEVDIAAATDVTVVVLTPASGDGVQAMKAGLMEIGDLFVVNKSDLEGAERFKHEVESMLDLRDESNRPEVVSCSALKEEGITDVAAALERRRQMEEQSGILQNRRNLRAQARVERLVGEDLRHKLWEEAGLSQKATLLLEAGVRPDSVARSLVQEVQNLVTQNGVKS